MTNGTIVKKVLNLVCIYADNTKSTHVFTENGEARAFYKSCNNIACAIWTKTFWYDYGFFATKLTVDVKQANGDWEILIDGVMYCEQVYEDPELLFAKHQINEAFPSGIPSNGPRQDWPVNGVDKVVLTGE